MIVHSNLLLQIFYSGFDAGPNWIILDDLQVLLKEKALSVVKEKISTVDEYRKYLDDEKLFTDGPGPQGKGHAALKEIGGKFLRENGLEPKFEIYFQGLHPDIADSGYRILIECGTTDPASILIFLQNNKVEWVGVIPYPSENEKSVFLYKFTRNKSFANYLESRISKLREVFRKVRG